MNAGAGIQILNGLVCLTKVLGANHVYEEMAFLIALYIHTAHPPVLSTSYHLHLNCLELKCTNLQNFATTVKAAKSWNVQFLLSSHFEKKVNQICSRHLFCLHNTSYLAEINFVHFYKEETRVKIHFELYPPLSVCLDEH